MRILQVNTYDRGGGAEAIAGQLQQGFRARDHDSWLAVGVKHTNDPRVLLIKDGRPGTDSRWARRWWNSTAKVLPSRGQENYNFTDTWGLLDLPPQRPQILHCHNLHGWFDSSIGYFDLRALPWLSRRVPLILTLHDAWLLSGHCAHSFDCERWKTGCGGCPDLTIYPPVTVDATAANLRLKRRIFKNSRLHVATPCQWLMDKVNQSVLASGIVGSRVIHNGVDLIVFRPGDKRQARAKLGLPEKSRVLLFAANGIRQNQWKDYQTMREAVARVAESLHDQEVEFIALGEDAAPEQAGKALIRFVPFQNDPLVLASYYQAADVYVHAARAETFPNVIIEAEACGCPVVATRVGGIPEQIEDGIYGFLTAPRNAADMAARICLLLSDDAMLTSMGTAAAAFAVEKRDSKQLVSAYLRWYDEILQ